MSETASKLLSASSIIQSAKVKLKTVVDDVGRFNDVDGSEENIHGFDAAAVDGDDTLFGYAGTDENGNHVIGGGFLDVERSEGGLKGVEVLTANGEIEYDGNGEIIYLEGEANGVEFDFGPFLTDQVNLTVFGKATGNVGIGQDRAGAYGTLSVMEITFANGEPSANNNNDIGVTAGLALGIGFGLNLVYGDPDGDGIRNIGFEGAYGPVSGGFTSEWLGRQVVELDNTAIAAYNDIAETAADVTSGAASSVINAAAGGVKSLTGTIPGIPWG